ncbi:MAG: hypothetical protein ACK559_25390, partial [bacterium]
MVGRLYPVELALHGRHVDDEPRIGGGARTGASCSSITSTANSTAASTGSSMSSGSSITSAATRTPSPMRLEVGWCFSRSA